MNQAKLKPTEAEVIDLTERGWLPRFCQGDEQAFLELFQHYSGFVMTFLCRYGVRKDCREDLFQQVFMNIFRSADSYQPSRPLRPWLVTIILNSVRNHRRNDARKNRFLARLRDGETWQSESVAGTAQMYEQRSTVRWLESRIGKLPDRQREALVLSSLKGLSMRDIAKVMGLPVNTVKTHLRRARLALASELASHETTENHYEPL